MQWYFKKKHRTHLDLLSIPRLWGGKNKQTQNTREAWDTTQFLVFVTLHLYIDVDVILGTCSTIEIISPICLKKNQSTPRPSEHPPRLWGKKCQNV